MSQTTELIRGLRNLGLSQSEIARRTKIPQPRISRWERGEAPDSADDALKLRDLHVELIGQPGAPVVPTASATADQAAA
jgi:transcriptional regulator with XRE-family HTH domain